MRGSFKGFLFFLIIFFPLVFPGNAGAEDFDALPKGFRAIELGMDLEKVKEVLSGDSYFLFRGDPDVSMLEKPNRTLIECKGSFFIHRAFFQFYEEKLYIIILMLNQEQLDHYSLFTTLSERYGKPQHFSPQRISWSSKEVELSLERPLTVKYLDLVVFEELKMKSRAEESLMQGLRENFLKQF